MNLIENGPLDAQYSVDSLKQGLLATGKIVYRDNGNRAHNAKIFLRKIEKVVSRAGITRVADISDFGTSRYPVYQSCRPNIMYPPSYGQNTGAQGKGPTEIQAKISCIMESLESYCAEPRNPNLITGSFSYLSKQHLILDPHKFHFDSNRKGPNHEEALVWTPAYSLKADATVLVPAEAIYFPFRGTDYSTQGYFISGSNGLASGSTYLEAAIHGLYEVIERSYEFHFQTGNLRAEAIYEEEIKSKFIKHYLKNSDGDFELQLYALEMDGKKNLPVVLALLAGDGICYEGWGCSATLDVSIERAVSEAFQSQVTSISGSREDLSIEQIFPDHLFSHVKQPERRTLRIKDYRKRVHDLHFKSLIEEFLFIKKWLKLQGHENIFLANLTRCGIDIPVVKVLVPSLPHPLR